MRLHMIMCSIAAGTMLLHAQFSSDAGDTKEQPAAGQHHTMIAAPPWASVSAVLKSDLWQVLRGGVASSSEFIGNADVMLTADLGAAAGLTGSTFYAQFLANNGGGVNHGIGEAQMVTNIEGYRTLRLYQCWVEKEFPDAQVALLAGLFDLNAEFYVTPTSGVFLNASHGIGIDLSQTGTNGPSIFPSTALAARVRIGLTENVQTAAAVFDASPGHPLDGAVFDATVRSQDGFLLISETDYSSSDGRKLAVGAWYYTGAYATVCGEYGLEEYREVRQNGGLYLLADLPVYAEPGTDGEGVSLFSRFGIANAELNAVGSFYGGGVVYTGLFDGRPSDKLGYAVARASFGNDHRAVCSSLGVEMAAFELVHEITYRAVLTSWLTLQGDLQYVVHPSGSLNIRSALAGGFRMETGF
ncbi:MAG: carbohydrate porin [Bacteroidetes bacterium]|nr:carbohydrate porin [Bacteroidota bacterium]